MKINLIFYMIACILLSFGQVYGETIAVIVNKDNAVSKLDINEVKKLYENDQLEWKDGKSVYLYDLPISNPAREKFSQAALGKDADKVASEWAKKKIANRAKNPPLTVKSGILVQDKVGKEVNAIGYLPKNEINSDKVKVVLTIE